MISLLVPTVTSESVERGFSGALGTTGVENVGFMLVNSGLVPTSVSDCSGVTLGTLGMISLLGPTATSESVDGTTRTIEESSG